MTKMDIPDWESQMREMFATNIVDPTTADDMIARFSRIIDEHNAENEPVTTAAVALTEADVHKYLPVIAQFLQGHEHDTAILEEIVWFFGMEMCQRYMAEESIEFSEGCQPAVHFFFGSMDDDDTVD
ncbi:hypothetical protein [Caudoviricetes sp.]|nr:hypothetical protein [Caudoviricetes sp.]